ncbi:HlyD family type I secretion periplasmic adaptor subunit [Agrobacterium cavarae]|uniref:HlyD family type I secretion periplasmic adaptor subunit n=1 Tax=Agrobacterium cavarae TaxID=2528239 RepID=UPI003EE783A7
MNNVVKLQRVGRPLRADQEFLAPALEILETPPSPVRMALIVIIAAFFAVAIAWSAISRIDIIATAQGKVEPTLKVKVVQPLAAGKVSDVLAHNGDHVKEGQVLVKLDSAAAAAQLDDLTGQLMASQAEVARRQSAIALVSAQDWKPSSSLPAIVWPAGTDLVVRGREQRVLQLDLAQLASQVAVINSQIAQKVTSSNSSTATIAAQRELVATLGKLTGMRDTSAHGGMGSTAEWLNTLQAEQRERVALQIDINEKADADASIDVLRRQAQSATQSFLADYSQKLEAAEAQVEDLTQKVRQAKSQFDDMTLVSPVDGIVEASTLTSTGQVLASGAEVMRIVPDGSHLDVQAFLTNDQIGFVKPGQEVTIKIDAFPYTQYGTVKGTVLQVGKDAVSAAQAQADLADSSFTANTSTSVSNSQASNGLVFPIVVQMDSDVIGSSEGTAKVSPGMSVAVDINTGTRTILAYLFAPLIDVTSSALHER